jgi:MFS family permease
MSTMATAIATVAAPAAGASLHLSGTSLELMASGYILAYSVLLMTGARLGDYGYRRMFLIGLTVFTAAAAVSGAAPTGAVLIVGQIAQGIGAALMVPQVLSFIQHRFEGPARSRALGLYSMVLAVGVAAALLLGGALATTDLFGLTWRPAFLIDVPIGIILLIVARLTLPDVRTQDRRSLDMPGVLVLTTALLAVIVPLTFGNSQHWPTWTWITLVVGAAGLGGFLALQRATAARGGHPLLNISATAAQGVRGGLLAVFVVMGGYGALLFSLSLYLQQGYGYTPLGSGLTFATYAAGFAAINLTWARLPQRVHPYIPLFGMIILAAAEAALAATVRTGWTYGTEWPLLLLAGIGHGAGFGALVHQITARSRPEHVATLSGVITTVAQLAIVVGIATLGGLYLTMAHLGHRASFDHALSLIVFVLAIITAASTLAVIRLMRASARAASA